MNPINRGRKYRRTKFEDPITGSVNRERVFADAWEDENEPREWLNFGQGILQDLFMERESWQHQPSATHVINRRERMIVATVIQWLGSNCGWCWLNQCLNKCGYRLDRIDK